MRCHVSTLLWPCPPSDKRDDFPSLLLNCTAKSSETVLPSEDWRRNWLRSPRTTPCMTFRYVERDGTKQRHFGAKCNELRGDPECHRGMVTALTPSVCDGSYTRQPITQTSQIPRLRSGRSLRLQRDRLVHGDMERARRLLGGLLRNVAAQRHGRDPTVFDAAVRSSVESNALTLRECALSSRPRLRQTFGCNGS